jgi:hypothetical protein
VNQMAHNDSGVTTYPIRKNKENPKIFEHSTLRHKLEMQDPPQRSWIVSESNPYTLGTSDRHECPSIRGIEWDGTGDLASEHGITVPRRRYSTRPHRRDEERLRTEYFSLEDLVRFLHYPAKTDGFFEFGLPFRSDCGRFCVEDI